MTEIRNKRIVITGATGFIGRNAAKLFLEHGAEVFVLVRPQSKQKALLPIHENLHVVDGGLAEIDSPAVQKQNIDWSLECVEAAGQLGCSVFMDAGSRVEYGIKEDGVMSEDMDCNPVNEYGKAKLAFYRQAKPLCEKWKMTYYHLRFFSVYGAGDHPWSIISTLVRDLPQGKTVSLSACMHRWNFMDIEDASRAILELYRYSDSVEQGHSEIVNIASEDTRRLREFVEEIHGLCEKKGQLEYGTFVQAKEGALSICPTVDVLKRLTGNTWKERVTFAEGIGRMLQINDCGGVK